MTRDEIVELAAVYALGALDGEDRAVFEALLQSDDPVARAALRGHEETLGALAAELAEAPPASVKSALMARIAAAPGPDTARLPIGLARPRRRLWPVIWAG